MWQPVCEALTTAAASPGRNTCLLLYHRKQSVEFSTLFLHFMLQVCPRIQGSASIWGCASNQRYTVQDRFIIISLGAQDMNLLEY